MGTAVAEKQNNALAAANALKGKLSKVKQQMPETGGSQYLRMLQDGHWVFGAENNEVDKKDEVAINPLSIKTGFVCWTDHDKQKNEVVDEMMFPMGADVPLRSDLPDKGWPWAEQFSVQMKFLSGKHKGKQVEYKTTSKGGINAMQAVIDQIMLQLDEDPEAIVPVVHLDVDHYNHTKYGRTYVPDINIFEWMTMEGPDGLNASVDGEETEEQEEEKPKEEAPKRSRRSSKPKEEPEETEEETEEQEQEQEQEEEQASEPEEGQRRRRRRR